MEFITSEVCNGVGLPIKMNTARKPTECLLNNIIDKDIQATLRPFNIIQKIFLLSNFTIINNFITPNYAVFHIKSVVGALLLMLINNYRYLKDSDYLDSVGKPAGSCIVLSFDLIHVCVSCAMLYIVSAMQSSNFVLLIVKLQYILNAINLDRKMTMFNFELWNWIYITSITSFYLIIVIIAKCFIHRDVFLQISLTLPLFLFDLQIVYVSRLVEMLSYVLSLWHSKMVFYKNVHYNLNQEAIRDDNLSGNKMLNAYKDILKSFRLTEKIFSFVILYYVFTSFFLVLETLQFIVDYEKINTFMSTVEMNTWKITTLFWLVKSSVLLIKLSFACEKFYENIKVAQSFSCKLFSIEESDLRRTCKNVVRYNRAASRKLSVFGLFHVDAALTPRLLAAVLAYTVVLLQFALL